MSSLPADRLGSGHPKPWDEDLSFRGQITFWGFASWACCHLLAKSVLPLHCTGYLVSASCGEQSPQQMSSGGMSALRGAI